MLHVLSLRLYSQCLGITGIHNDISMQTMSIFTDDDSYRESELAITRQGAPYASSYSDRSSNSTSEKSVNT